MKRFLTIALLGLACLCACFFANEIRRDTRQETALCLVESFGWAAEKKGLQQQDVTARNFYSLYYNWIGKGVFFSDRPAAPEDVAQGNLAGMRPVLYDQTYEAVPEERMVTLYFVPLDEQMPEHTALEAIIGFDGGRLCMAALHVRLTAEVSDAPIPLTWPLGVDRSVVETWKSNFMHYQTRVP